MYVFWRATCHFQKFAPIYWIVRFERLISWISLEIGRIHHLDLTSVVYTRQTRIKEFLNTACRMLIIS